MKQVNLGHTNIKISEMGLGNVDFGTKVDEKQAFKVLDAFVDKGGTFIDTSNNYALWNPGGTGGECEQIIGNWMKSRGNRDKIVLATKMGANVQDLDSVKKPDGSLMDDWYLKGEGLSRKAIFNAIEGSLKRLQTDHIDLYYAHVEDPTVDPEETLSAFDELEKQGKIRAIGCSNHSIWRVERAKQISRNKGLIEYCCVQDLHSYLKPMASKRNRYATNDTLDYIRNNPDTTLVSYTPTIWGKLSKVEEYGNKEFWGEFYTRDTEKRLQILRETAEAHGATEVQIVFAWMRQTSPAAVPLMATKSVDHVIENIAACDIKLSSEELKRLDEAGA